MESLTSGVQTLLGDPKRAVLRLSLPMMAAMFVQSLYNIVDAIWVAGLGSEALAAVGLFFPFMTGMMALATGLGVGGSSAVSRRIGARDKASAERAALLTLSLGVLVSLLFLFAHRGPSGFGRVDPWSGLRPWRTGSVVGDYPGQCVHGLGRVDVGHANGTRLFQKVRARPKWVK